MKIAEPLRYSLELSGGRSRLVIVWKVSKGAMLSRLYSGEGFRGLLQWFWKSTQPLTSIRLFTSSSYVIIVGYRSISAFSWIWKPIAYIKLLYLSYLVDPMRAPQISTATTKSLFGSRDV